MPRLAALPPIAIAIAIAATAGAARADDDPKTWPHRTVLVSAGIGAQYLRNESLAGPALFAEYGVGRGRWQWVPNGDVQWFLGEGPGRIGYGVQLGLDARWLARSIEPDSSAALQLFINGGAAVELLELGGDAITRPKLGVGWGFQVRALRDHQWIVRFGFRFELAPALDAREVARIVCRGECASAPTRSPVDEGFKAILGFGW